MLMRSGGGAYIRKASDWLLSPYCQITFYLHPSLTISCKSNKINLYTNAWRSMHFYRAMLAQRAVMRLHVVRPSVCLSVCLSVTIRYRVQIRLNSSKIISRPNSLRSMRSFTPNMGDLVQREQPIYMYTPLLNASSVE